MIRALVSNSEKAAYFIKFNVDGLLRGDYQSRMNGYAIGRQNGWLSTNDIRELENMNPVSEDDGGDALLVNGNMLPIKAILAKVELANALTEGLIVGDPNAPPEPAQESDEETDEETDDKTDDTTGGKTT